jgi:hypothetical protein
LIVPVYGEEHLSLGVENELAAAGAGMRKSPITVPVWALDDTVLADGIFINITPGGLILDSTTLGVIKPSCRRSGSDSL